MRSLVGGFVLLAGIGVGLFVYLPIPVDRNASLENAQRLWTQANRSSIPSPVPVISRSFSPHLSLAHLAPPKSRHAKRPASSGDRSRCVFTDGKRAPEPPGVAPATNSGAKQRSDHRGSCFEGRKLATLIVNAVPSGECRRNE